MITKIAWRNIWRNRRRTLITAASIFFAVFFAVIIYSLNRGLFDKMVNDAVNSYMGYGQIHQKGYWEERLIDNSFELTTDLTQQIKASREVQEVVPRLEASAMVSVGKTTKTALVVGIDPAKEDGLTKLAQKIEEGEYLKAGDKAILVGKELARKLKVTIGDSLILLSQGYRGVNAAQIYPIKGIISFGSPELNRTMVYMPLALAQDFYGAPNMISTAVLHMNNEDEANRVLPNLMASIDTASTYEIMGWKELMPEIVEMMALKDSSNIVMVFVLYLIISFGIFGVIVMMTKERTYEFGVLLSIGMKRKQLAFVVWLETLLIGFIGIVVGLFVSYGLCYYLKFNPIPITGDMAITYKEFGVEPLMPASTGWDIFAAQALVVFIIITLLALYPCLKIFWMKPMEAIRA